MSLDRRWLHTGCTAAMPTTWRHKVATKITARTVEAARTTQQRFFIWDKEIPGFGLRVLPSGAKHYVLKYRTGRGCSARQRWVTIGRHGAPWTPDLARREARRLLGCVADGVDPASDRDEAKRNPTIRELAERFDAEHMVGKLKPRTAHTYRNLLRRFIVPKLGTHRTAELTRGDIAQLHAEMCGTPRQANMTLALIRKMMNLAEAWGLRADGSNPCRHIQNYPERRLERFLSEVELARLGTVLAEAERKGSAVLLLDQKARREVKGAEAPHTIAAIRLLAFTGARMSEVMTLRWEHVDFERRALLLPDSKTGRKTIHLNAPALELLANLPRKDQNPFVFIGRVTGQHVTDLQHPWQRVRKSASLPGVRLHDLRHTFASVAVAGGYSLRVTGELLGHSQAATTARYAHLAADPVREAGEVIGKRIADALSGTPAIDPVPMKRRA
jgi:integrase